MAISWVLFPGGVLKEVKTEHGHTLNREVARNLVVFPGGVLKEVNILNM